MNPASQTHGLFIFVATINAPRMFRM